MGGCKGLSVGLFEVETGVGVGSGLTGGEGEDAVVCSLAG